MSTTCSKPASTLVLNDFLQNQSGKLGKTRTPVYSVMLDNGANGTAKVFWVVRNEELANGFRDFIRRELERM